MIKYGYEPEKAYAASENASCCRQTPGLKGLELSREMLPRFNKPQFSEAKALKFVSRIIPVTCGGFFIRKFPGCNYLQDSQMKVVNKSQL